VPAGPCELSQYLDDPLGFVIELAPLVVSDDPESADRFGLDVKRNEQGFDDRRHRRQPGEKALCHVHELRGVPTDRRAARACISGRRAVESGRVRARQCLPPEHLRAIMLFQQADSRRVGAAKLKGNLDQFLQDRLRRLGHRPGQRHERAVFGFVIGWPGGPAGELRIDDHIVQIES
jgi:hypothetical protein